MITLNIPPLHTPHFSELPSSILPFASLHQSLLLLSLLSLLPFILPFVLLLHLFSSLHLFLLSLSFSFHFSPSLFIHLSLSPLLCVSSRLSISLHSLRFISPASLLCFSFSLPPRCFSPHFVLSPFLLFLHLSQNISFPVTLSLHLHHFP